MSPSPGGPNYILIGHVTHDVHDDGTISIGGTASYAALTAYALGYSVGVLTSAGPTFDVSKLEQVGEIVVDPAPVTTTFKNEYIDGSRHQVIYDIANNLEPRHLPKTWTAPLVVHVAPVFGECDPEFFQSFHQHTYLGVTLQGMLRSKMESGCVVPRKWVEGLEFLQSTSSVIVSEDDIQADWQFAAILAQVTRILIITCGSRGGFIYQDNERVPFYAPHVAEHNPTGAGDIFSAAFFIAAAKGHDPYTAALFASCLAAQSVTRVGLASTPTKAEIQKCSLNALEA